MSTNNWRRERGLFKDTKRIAQRSVYQAGEENVPKVPPFLPYFID